MGDDEEFLHDLFIFGVILLIVGAAWVIFEVNLF